MDHVLKTAKAYTALLGAVVTALLGIYGPDTEVGHWLTIVAAVLTAVSTYAVPNSVPAPENTDPGDDADSEEN